MILPGLQETPIVTTAKSTSVAKARRARRRLRTEDYQALGAFRHALRKFMAFSEAGSQKLGLTPQQHQAILAIRAHSGTEAMTIGELAESLLIKNHSAVGLVERLGKRNLVVRSHSERDRRRVVLVITPEAEAILETISRNNLGELNRAADTFVELLSTVRRLDADGLWSDPP